MAVLLSYFQVPLTWGDVSSRTIRETIRDNCVGMAAELAYYFFFALFPALLVLLSIASYFPVDSLVDDIFRTLGGFVPPEALQIITDQITKISEGEHGGLLTLGVLTALWSSSAAMTGIIDTLNKAYDIEEGRPWWLVRLTGIGLTLGVAVFILVSFALVLVGPALAERIAATVGLGPAFVWSWTILQWPVIFALVSGAIAITYYFAPDADQDWVWLTPGSILATLIWLVSTLGLKYYVASFGKYNETYGAIGAVMVLLLWFYVSGLAILIGAEMNAEIEHASPYGKARGEKVPGRKTIGPAAMRVWLAETRPAKRPATGAPMPAPARAPALPPAPVYRPALPPARRFSDGVVGAAVVGAMLWRAAARVRRSA